jgi:putative copper export protein
VAAAPAPAKTSGGGSFLSRHDITEISLFFHIPAITLWVGLAMFDIFALVTPGFEPEQRARLISRFKWFSVVLIVIIMITGIWQTLDNPFHRVDSYSSLEYLRNNYAYGTALFVKHIFVIATFGVSILVRFYLAPRTEVSVIEGDGAAALSQTKLLTWMAVLNLALTLAAVVAASRMTIELH